jgi:outer membrane receptor protein involved in Fe transport
MIWTVISPTGRALCALLLAPALSALPAARAWAQAGDLEPGADRETGIAGRIVDRRSNRGLKEAPVLVQGPAPQSRVRTVYTGGQGNYRLQLPPGEYTIRSYYDLYHGARIDGVPVERGKLQQVSLLLQRIDEERDVAVVELEVPYRADTTTAAAQDQLRQAASGIGEGFGARQMSQVGASDAGSAAARVVGVSIESSQLVIRGLAGRYNRVLLNGIPVPSTDPDSPGVDLDLFPTSVIDSLTLSKTFLPDSPADFAGGVMEIRSVNFPRQFTFELEASTGFNSESTFRERIDYQGGSYDRLGFDDGRRALPGTVPAGEPLSPNANGRFKNIDDLEAPAESFRDSWQYSRRNAVPNLGLEATVGDSRKLAGSKRLGYLATASYDHGSLRRRGTARPNPTFDAADGSLVARNDYTIETGSDEVQLTGLGTASLDIGVNHALTALTLWNRSVSDETTLVHGLNQDLQDTQYTKWQLDFLARVLWFNQVFGEHRNLGGTRWRLRWAGFYAYGLRDEPDRRTVALGSLGDGVGWLEKSGSGERFFSNLRQDDVGATASLRFPLWSQSWGNAGGFTQLSTRTFENRRFRMLRHPSGTAADASVFHQPVEDLFGATGIGTLTRIVEDTRDSDSYHSRQTLFAGYFLLETPLRGPLSFAGGVRSEILGQEVTSRSPFAATQPTAKVTRTDRTDVDHLPGATLKYQLTDKTLLRAAYGMTVSRPQIRELAPFQFYDFVRERNIEGNPELERTLIHNADLRWEWFFGEGEVAAASAFYKQFHKPIELQIRDPDSGGSQFINASSAWNVGGEVELRLSLGRLGRLLRWFNLDSNLALIHSQVELPTQLSTAVKASRPLFGQSPYVFNVSLRFHQEATGVTSALVYNVVGARITDVGTTINTAAGNQFFPNTEERPFHSLDLVAGAQVWPRVKLKLKVKNILQEREELRQGSYLVRRRDPGISASLGVTLAY